MGAPLAAAVSGALLLVGAVDASRSAKPSVSVVDRTPVVVQGSGFGPRERVLVAVQTDLFRATQRASATRTGRFLVRFDGIRLTPCTGGSIVATGSRGHSARLKLVLRECPGPALDP